MESPTPICLFTVQHLGALVTIKGSLPMSLPIIKRFWLKCPAKKASKNSCFWDLRWENFWSWSWDPPRKSISTGTRRLTQKRWRYSQKSVLQTCARNHKKNKKNIWTWYFTPSPEGPLLGPCWADRSKFLHVGWHPRRNHAYQILSRSRRGLRSYGGPNSGFSYSFLNRSYNTVTHYRATLWSTR